MRHAFVDFVGFAVENPSTVLDVIFESEQRDSGGTLTGVLGVSSGQRLSAVLEGKFSQTSLRLQWRF